MAHIVIPHEDDLLTALSFPFLMEFVVFDILDQRGRRFHPNGVGRRHRSFLIHTVADLQADDRIVVDMAATVAAAAFPVHHLV